MRVAVLNAPQPDEKDVPNMATDYIVKDIALQALAAKSWILPKLKCRA